MNLGDLHKVWEIKALKRKPGEEEAKKILEKIANQVQPIMRKRNWRVKVLSEFCPNNPALLGLNVGAGVHVKLRLRRVNRDWDFIPYNQVLDTMLHELCHNAHGPHNASFYKLWDELRKECEELISKGITGTGEGFDLPGKRLGGFFRQPPISSLRQTALSAAEKRSKLGSLLPSGPQRLGGDSSIMGALSPIQAAAMAAERRLQDEIWCGSQSAEVFEDVEGSSDISEGLAAGPKMVETSGQCNDRKRNFRADDITESVQFNDHSNSRFVDLSKIPSISGSTNDHVSGHRKRTRIAPPNSTSHPKGGFVDLTGNSSFQSVSDHAAVDMSGEAAMWQCGICTLLNPPLAPLCELCSAEKPKDVNVKFKIWSCKFCTLENSVDADKCSACDQWRYSHGPPVSSQAPNLGT